MQSISSRIWTRVAVSNSYDDNRGHLITFFRLFYFFLSFFLSPPTKTGWRFRTTLTASLQKYMTPINKCPVYDTKQSDGEVPVMLELWGVRSIPWLPSLLGPLWPGVIAPNKGPVYGSKENQCTYTRLNCLNEDFIYMKIDLALNNLQLLICHKNQPNQIIYI